MPPWLLFVDGRYKGDAVGMHTGDFNGDVAARLAKRFLWAFNGRDDFQGARDALSTECRPLTKCSVNLRTVPRLPVRVLSG